MKQFEHIGVDLVRDACVLAVIRNGTTFSDRTFHAAGFGVAFGELSGMGHSIDGNWVRAILSGRKDVEQSICDDAYFRLSNRLIVPSVLQILVWMFALIGLIGSLGFAFLCVQVGVGG